MRQALIAAAERGVQVEILVAGQSDHPLFRFAARARIPALIEHGIRVFEYERAMMHAKVAVFDDRLAIVGTSNLDQQSLQHSYEVNLIVEGGGVPEELSKMVRSDIADATEVTAATLARRSRLECLRDRAAAALVSRL